MKYLIKKTYTATGNNKECAGQKRVWFYGPSGLLASALTRCRREEAYRSKASVLEGLLSAQEIKASEEETGFWKIDLEVVKV